MEQEVVAGAAAEGGASKGGRV